MLKLTGLSKLMPSTFSRLKGGGGATAPPWGVAEFISEIVTGNNVINDAMKSNYNFLFSNRDNVITIVSLAAHF